MDNLFNNQSKTTNKSHLWPDLFHNEILFPDSSFESLLSDLGYNFDDWFNYWQRRGGKNLASYSWSKSTRLDWIWGLGFPLLTEIQRCILNEDEMSVLGISALPGCGKSSLGKWLEASAKELNWPINVISIDDFYLAGKELDDAMSGNPWDVPRGLPGSHSTDLFQEVIDKWRFTGTLKAPQFDKALRNGLGDRSGWINAKPKVLVIEGWFLGCLPSKNKLQETNKSIKSLETTLSASELKYREQVQKSLIDYIPIWEKFKRIWHIKPSDFLSSSKWKIDQENEMYRTRGSSLRGESLNSFVRMIQVAIPPQSLMNIESNIVVRINQSRQVLWVGKKDEEELI